MKNIWRRFAAHFQFRTRYTRELEQEIARLRDENRAILNSVLGTAGFPPLRSAMTLRAGTAPGANRTSRPPLRNSLRDAPSAASHAAPSSADEPLRTVRRRSWHQAVRSREIEDARAARRDRETDAASFPPPRNAVVREIQAPTSR